MLVQTLINNNPANIVLNGLRKKIYTELIHNRNLKEYSLSFKDKNGYQRAEFKKFSFEQVLNYPSLYKNMEEKYNILKQKNNPLYKDFAIG